MHHPAMDICHIPNSIDTSETCQVDIRQASERGGDGAVVFCGPSTNRIAGSTIARGKAGAKDSIISFEQNHQVWTQSAAAEGVEREDRFIAQSPGSALIGAA